MKIKFGSIVVVSHKNIPTQVPFWQTLTTILWMDYRQASFWEWVVAIVMLALWWLGSLVLIWAEKPIDIGRLRMMSFENCDPWGEKDSSANNSTAKSCTEKCPTSRRDARW